MPHNQPAIQCNPVLTRIRSRGFKEPAYLNLHINPYPLKTKYYRLAIMPGMIYYFNFHAFLRNISNKFSLLLQIKTNIPTMIIPIDDI